MIKPFSVRVILCCLCSIAIFVSCQGADQSPARDPAVQSAQTPVSPLVSESPLASGSPLATTVTQPAPLPTDYEKPTQPYLLFSSTRAEGSNWYLLDPSNEEVAPIQFSGLSGYRINSLTWAPQLNLFLAQLFSDPNHSDLYLVDFGGNIVAQVTSDPYEEGGADYSPATKAFTYVCLRQDLDICSTTPLEPEMVNLTAMRTREAGPKWSPNGEQILFVSNGSGINNVWTMNADGTERQNLSQVALGDELFEEGNASWSPDGQQILFRSQADGKAEIYVMDADGHNRRNLTNHPAVDTDPLWSPDGQFVAFRSDRDDGSDIYILEVATSNVVNVSGSPDARENNFIWSPDSQRIFFDSPEEGNYEIYVVNRDGSEKRNLTNNPAEDVDPQWIE